MKHLSRLILILMSAVWLVPSLYAQTHQLVIAHTNDTHSQIQPLSPLLADTSQAGKGGFLRRAALLRSLRERYPDMLLFDSGDFSQGSAYYNLFKGEVEVRLMNEMKYDAVTLGNHEFDNGLDNMRRIFSLATFPVVNANYDFSETVLGNMVRKSIVLERNGLRIGVFGLGPQLEGVSAAANYVGVVYHDPLTAANQTARQLKDNQHCDVVICLSHLGWDEGVVNDSLLIPLTHDIDIVLGGHSHTLFNEPKIVYNADGHKVVCNQLGKNGIYVGLLTVTFQPQIAVSEERLQPVYSK